MWLFTADGFWQRDGERLSLLDGAGHWEFDQAPVDVWATQIELGVLGFF